MRAQPGVQVPVAAAAAALAAAAVTLAVAPAAFVKRLAARAGAVLQLPHGRRGQPRRSHVQQFGLECTRTGWFQSCRHYEPEQRACARLGRSVAC